MVYGFQIQPGTKWREGLTSTVLAEFENEMGYEFPLPLTILATSKALSFGWIRKLA